MKHSQQRRRVRAAGDRDREPQTGQQRGTIEGKQGLGWGRHANHRSAAGPVRDFWHRGKLFK